MKIIVILFSSMLLALPIYGQNRETDYLSHVLEKMNAVESVTYHCVKKAWEPGDKEPVDNVPREEAPCSQSGGTIHHPRQVQAEAQP